MARTELELTVDLILHLSDFEVHLASARAMPVGRADLVQQFDYVLGAWSFDLQAKASAAVTHKNPLPSP